MCADTHARHPRETIAEHNLEAILDATERLLARHEQPSVSAVATEAGVSRPTVYAHFPDRSHLLEAVVERAVRRTMEAVRSAEPEEGPALPALRRLLVTSWRELGRYEDISRGAAAELSAEALHRAHHAANAALRDLADRGRREGAFRTDIPTSMLVTSCLAVIHATAEAIRNGELDRDAAAAALPKLLAELFVGPRGPM